MRKTCAIPRRTAPAAAAACPIWVQKVRWMFEAKQGPLLKFRCGDNLQSAMFVSRTDKTQFHILHQATKRPGQSRANNWQMSSFDNAGAIGDVIGTCDVALQDTLPKHWRLVEVIARKR